MKKNIHIMLAFLLVFACISKTNAQSEQDFTNPKYSYTIPYFNGTSAIYNNNGQPGIKFNLYTSDPRYNWYSHVSIYVEGKIRGHVTRELVWSRDFSRSESSNGLELLLDVDSTRFDSNTKLSFFIYPTQYIPDPNHVPYDYYHYAPYNYMAQLSGHVSNRALIMIYNQFEGNFFTQTGLLSTAQPTNIPEKMLIDKHFDATYVGSGNSATSVIDKLPVNNVLFMSTHGDERLLLGPDAPYDGSQREYIYATNDKSLINKNVPLIDLSVNKKLPSQPKYNFVLSLSCHAAGYVGLNTPSLGHPLPTAFQIYDQTTNHNKSINKCFVGFQYFTGSNTMSVWGLSVLNYLLAGKDIDSATKLADKSSTCYGFVTIDGPYKPIKSTIIGDKKMKLRTLYKKSSIDVSWANVEVKPLP
jgi:hypothetical protein